MSAFTRQHDMTLLSGVLVTFKAFGPGDMTAVDTTIPEVSTDSIVSNNCLLSATGAKEVKLDPGSGTIKLSCD